VTLMDVVAEAGLELVGEGRAGFHV
jgi:hypothetical protein